MNRSPIRRRDVLSGLASLGGLTVGGGLSGLVPRIARAGTGVAERVIFFVFPDGVAGASQDGEPSLWDPTGSEFAFTLPELLTPLAARQQDCVFVTGLSMGPAEDFSHPGGAKKLLTAADYANNESIDQYLARTAGASAPWRHLYLGVQSNVDGATGDKHVSYVSPGVSIAPEDDPRQAFSLLFGDGGTGTGGTGGPADPAARSVLDTALADLADLKARMGTADQVKLDLHLEALREVEQRLDGVVLPPTCDDPWLDTSGVGELGLYAPELFPAQLTAQLDLMVLAMSCGLTRVGTIQCSHHTSELIMSRFPGTAMYDPAFDMRSHQASHYGASHDPAHLEYAAFVQQVQWWMSQFASLLDRLAATPEGDGTMLDHTICVACTEVSDGNTHRHDNLPVVVAGGAGGAWSTGRLLAQGYRRHGDLWVSVAQAMGESIDRFGDASSGPIPGLTG
ncbi:MAG: DUF1552 domain-containing protein [Myxococcota bacterium]